MHQSSLLKMAAFRDVHLAGGGRVLDVGASQSGPASYRPLFDDDRFEYIGLDIREGPNIDLVLADPFRWSEVPTGTFDAVITGQMFEHNPYFWVTMAEIARALKPGGVACVIAPSRGAVHYAPLDCWRFYPDAAVALCSYVGLDLVESYVEPDDHRTVAGTEWGDFLLVARQPGLDSVREERLQAILATALPMPSRATHTEGPAVAAYEESVRAPWLAWRAAVIGRKLLPESNAVRARAKRVWSSVFRSPRRAS